MSCTRAFRHCAIYLWSRQTIYSKCYQRSPMYVVPVSVCVCVCVRVCGGGAGVGVLMGACVYMWCCACICMCMSIVLRMYVKCVYTTMALCIEFLSLTKPS